MTTTKVTIETRTAGQNFGTEGIVRSHRTRRILARTDVVPLSFISAAIARAADICRDRGYDVVDCADFC
jgi:hypothetical protein